MASGIERGNKMYLRPVVGLTIIKQCSITMFEYFPKHSIKEQSSYSYISGMQVASG